MVIYIGMRQENRVHPKYLFPILRCCARSCQSYAYDGYDDSYEEEDEDGRKKYLKKNLVSQLFMQCFALCRERNIHVLIKSWRLKITFQLSCSRGPRIARVSDKGKGYEKNVQFLSQIPF